MKTYTKYTPVTPKEALLALAENNGEPVGGFAFTDRPFPEPRHWDDAPILEGFKLGSTHTYYTDRYQARFCARIEEINPREVPEGVTPLPEDKPWLAYVPRDMLPNGIKFEGEVLQTGWGAGWYFAEWSIPDAWGDDIKVAIDVRTSYAKEHFPQIVEAMEYTEKRYGYTDDGEPIVAPEGWEIVPEGEALTGDNCWISYKGSISQVHDRLARDTAEVFNDCRAVLRRKSPVAKGHNPAKLTEAQVGDGWRLLSEEEIGQRINKGLVQYWDRQLKEWDTPIADTSKAFDCNIYRTQKPEGYFLPKGIYWDEEEQTLKIDANQGVKVQVSQEPFVSKPEPVACTAADAAFDRAVKFISFIDDNERRVARKIFDRGIELGKK